jgi:hypothetical protein
VGSRLTIAKATAIVQTATAHADDHHPDPKCRNTVSGSNASSAPAGEGIPTKNSLANGTASVSSSRVLNLAKRSTTQTVNTRATGQPTRMPCSDQTNKTTAGATPKETESASESSSAPIREVASSSRASRPSSASSSAANPIAASAPVKLPSRANFSADKPEHSASTVITLGSRRIPAPA